MSALSKAHRQSVRSDDPAASSEDSRTSVHTFVIDVTDRTAPWMKRNVEKGRKPHEDKNALLWSVAGGGVEEKDGRVKQKDKAALGKEEEATRAYKKFAAMMRKQLEEMGIPAVPDKNLVAAVRELEEETGIIASPFALVHIGDIVRPAEADENGLVIKAERIHKFYGLGVKRKPDIHLPSAKMGDEHIKVLWAPLDKPPEGRKMVHRPIHQGIKEFTPDLIEFFAQASYDIQQKLAHPPGWKPERTPASHAIQEMAFAK